MKSIFISLFLGLSLIVSGQDIAVINTNFIRIDAVTIDSDTKELIYTITQDWAPNSMTWVFSFKEGGHESSLQLYDTSNDAYHKFGVSSIEHEDDWYKMSVTDLVSMEKGVLMVITSTVDEDRKVLVLYMPESEKRFSFSTE